MFSFTLSEGFLEKYKDREVKWGFTDAGGNSLGELTYIRTYSRLKDDGTKEKWWETCARVINGMYSIQKDWVLQNRLEWNGHKAQASAQEAYDLMFNFKWTPPGRGLAQMGAPLVMEHRNAASLLNCAMVSTADMERHDPGYPFAWTTEALMLGIGAGFDTLGAGKFDVVEPVGETTYVIPDTREGWAKAIGKLVNSYLKPGSENVRFDYSEIRPYGSPISTFGGTASGPEPLEKGIEQIRGVLNENVGSKITSKTIVDIQNIIGTFVVAGNSRRCLPEGIRVNTLAGTKRIEDVRVGDYVVTAAGKAPVTNVFNQGLQDTVYINHRFGNFECTPNHRVAVYDSVSSYTFKRADELVSGDRMVLDTAWPDAADENNVFSHILKYVVIDTKRNIAPVEVLSVAPGRPGVQTYDIEVEGIHQFTAEGFIVHNSAEIALGSKDDESFINLKNQEVYPDRPWRWMSNNSVSVEVGDDYSSLVKNTVENGEPGYIFLDVTRKYGRLIDPPDYKDMKVAGFNPCCLVGSTTIMTSEGPRPISSLKGTPFMAIVDGQKYHSNGSWVSGVGDVYRLKTTEGYELQLTPEHQIKTASGEWVQAKDILIGDQIVLNNHRGFDTWGDTSNYGDGYLLGLFVGDGNFGSKSTSGNRAAHVKLWDDPGGAIKMVAEKYGREVPHRGDWGGFSAVSNRPYRQMSIGKLPARYGITPERKHDLATIEEQSSEFYRGFLSGLFDADGHVEGWNNDKGLSIRLGQSNYEMLQSVQRMLLRLGIKSTIAKARPAGTKLLPDGQGGSAEYSVRESFRLIIGSDHAVRFCEIVGFKHAEKKRKCDEHLESRKRFYHKPFLATVESFEHVGKHEVWDAEVADVHAFDANGIYAHNSEQPLESFEMCCLVTIHLNNIHSQEEFHRAIKYAYLYGKTVTLLTTPWEKTNAVMLRNRRIGLSTTGVAGYVENNSLAHYRELVDTGYKYVERLDKSYSGWLGIRESIRKTSGKPEGSVSLLSGATPGVHWSPGGEYFLRAVRFGSHDNTWKALEEAGYKVEDDLFSDNTKVVYFPIHQNVKRSEKEVSIFEKINLAVEMQRYWSDNGVSVTVSFDKDSESKHVQTVLEMYEGQLKAVSFLPMGNDVYQQAPYQSLTREEYESYIGKLRKVDMSFLYANGVEAESEAFCTNDVCVMPAK